jgi:polyhydroxyalkanoate synthase
MSQSSDNNIFEGPDFQSNPFAEQWMETSKQSADMVIDFLHQQQNATGIKMNIDENAVKAFHDMALRFVTDPEKLINSQMQLWSGLTDIWLNAAHRSMGLEPVTQTTGIKDRRFKDVAWEENVAFDYIKETYLLVSNWAQNLSEDADGMSKKDKKKVQFVTRQFASAISPSNFLLTNPEVMKKTIETGGNNLLDGLKNLLNDMERGHGELKVSMTDQDAFKVGENIANTPGKVIYRNYLFELIHYTPTTEKNYKTPILFVPPWINKFYVFDLKPENSYIKWVLDQGYSLFVISWVNPGPQEAQTAFTDYMKDGVLVALDQVLKVTGEKKANALGFCIGGILLTTTLAYMAAVGDKRINSATLLASMVDMTDVGEMSVFFDDDQLLTLGEKVEQLGYLEGKEMAAMFNMMRENDLVWSFVVNNYLMGKDPVPFDLLYWNADSTRMPARMIVEYLTGFYRDNAFMDPGRISFEGHDIDVRKIKTPTYMLATKEDHIAPWRACYAGVTSFSGPKKFVLGASGHIAGIVNPPVKKKYCHWVNKSQKAFKTPDEWFQGAEKFEGSWWTDWEQWIKKKSGPKVPARQPKQNKKLANAPGDYVLVRSD